MSILKVKNSNDEWVDIPSIIGPQGPQGPQGIQGPKGDPGEVTQAEFDELSGEVGDLNSALDEAIEDFAVPNAIK